MDATTEPKFLSIVIAAVREQVANDETPITAESTIGDLNLDSLDLVEISMRIEERVGQFDWPSDLLLRSDDKFDRTTVADLAIMVEAVTK